MKRFLCLTLALLMVLTMCACGESGGKEEKAALSVGIARVDMTPEPGVLLHGGGDSNRHATGVLDYLYVTAIAITDANDNTAILITQDTCDSNGSHSKANGNTQYK